MPFDTGSSLERLASLARRLPPTPATGWPAQCPDRDCERSPAAWLVASMAARQGLFLHHFEHTAHLPHPEAWVPPYRGDVGAPPQWQGGVLPESKYHSFRHDQAIGGFHPGHRGKWTTHELCHGLVGFAWRPDATPLFHALAGRLAELLPVVLYYFFDEAFLQRCPDHEGQGALFRRHCAACEAVACTTAAQPGAAASLDAGIRFLDRELGAIARSRRLGRIVPTVWATLDLASDGIAYADAHGRRLESTAFRWFVSSFLVDGGGWSKSLSTLEDRVLAVCVGILGGEAPWSLAPSPEHGRWRWIVQDVAWRLLTVWEDTDGQARRELEAVIGDLSEAIRLTTRGDAELAPVSAGVQGAIAAYVALCDDYVVPPPEEVFGVGYDLPGGYGRCRAAVRAGVASSTPRLASALGPHLDPLVDAFVAQDQADRTPLPTRWSEFLDEVRPGPLADLARFEAAVAVLRPTLDPARVLGTKAADPRVRLAQSVQVLQSGVDVLALADRADAGALTVDATGAVVDPPEPDPGALLLVPEPDGEVQILDVSLATSELLLALDGEGQEVELEPEEEQALRDLGVLVPVSWLEGRDPLLDEDEATQPF